MTNMIIKIIGIIVLICIYVETRKKKTYEENILNGLAVFLQIILIVYPIMLSLTSVQVS